MGKKAFDKFDTNGDGTISVEELSTVMESLGQRLKTKELKRMIAEVDANRNGKIDLEEFYILMGQKLDNLDREAEINEAFKVFDKDGNGYISRTELKQVMKSMGEKLSRS